MNHGIVLTLCNAVVWVATLAPSASLWAADHSMTFGFESGVETWRLAVFDEVEDVQLWIGFALDKFRRTMDALGDDGASHEGVGYWEYGVEYMLKLSDGETSLSHHACAKATRLLVDCSA